MSDRFIKKAREIVDAAYAESGSDWPILEPMSEALAAALREEAKRGDELARMLQGLINKCNVVTAEWRHCGKLGDIYPNSLDALYDRQCEAERALTPSDAADKG